MKEKLKKKYKNCSIEIETIAVCVERGIMCEKIKTSLQKYWNIVKMSLLSA